MLPKIYLVKHLPSLCQRGCGHLPKLLCIAEREIARLERILDPGSKVKLILETNPTSCLPARVDTYRSQVINEVLAHICFKVTPVSLLSTLVIFLILQSRVRIDIVNICQKVVL